MEIKGSTPEAMSFDSDKKPKGKKISQLDRCCALTTKSTHERNYVAVLCRLPAAETVNITKPSSVTETSVDKVRQCVDRTGDTSVSPFLKKKKKRAEWPHQQFARCRETQHCRAPLQLPRAHCDGAEAGARAPARINSCAPGSNKRVKGRRDARRIKNKGICLMLNCIITLIVERAGLHCQINQTSTHKGNEEVKPH